MGRGLFRSFKADFCQHMTLEKAWPDETAVNNYRGERMHPGSYRALKHGNVRSEQYIVDILAVVLKDSDLPEIVNSRDALFNYLGRIERPKAVSTNPKEIIDLVCDGVRFRREDKNTIDAFERWIDLVAKLFPLKRPIIDYVRPCEDAKDVRQAIDWMFIEEGRDVGGKRLSRDAARRLTETRLKVDFEEYVDSAIKWHDRNPWTIVWAQGDRAKVGMCLNLPVTEEFYDDVKRGKRTSHSCAAAELELPARHLIVEGLAARPRECDRSFADTKPMLFALLSQQARLTDISRIGWDFPLLLLSFAATRANTTRLRWSGYHSVGTRMIDTGLEIYERVFDAQNEPLTTFIDCQILTTWWRVQAELRKGFGPLSNDA